MSFAPCSRDKLLSFLQFVQECDGLCFEVSFLYLELDCEWYLRHSVVGDVSPLGLDALWGDVKTL